LKLKIIVLIVIVEYFSVLHITQLFHYRVIIRLVSVIENER